MGIPLLPCGPPPASLARPSWAPAWLCIPGSAAEHPTWTLRLLVCSHPGCWSDGQPLLRPARPASLQWTGSTCWRRSAAAGAASSPPLCTCRWSRGALCRVRRAALLMHSHPPAQPPAPTHPPRTQQPGRCPCIVLKYVCAVSVSWCCSSAHRFVLWQECVRVTIMHAPPPIPAELGELAGKDASAPLELISDFHERMERRGRWGAGRCGRAACTAAWPHAWVENC